MSKIKYPFERFAEIQKRYPPQEKSPLVIPFLKEIQLVRGFISNEDIDFLSKHLEVPKIQIEEVLEFYTMLKRNPEGRHHIQICRNLTCSLLGAGHIIDHICKKLRTNPGETTADGKFTVSLVECLASCGTAPMMQIDDQFYENLTPEKVDQILGDLP